MKRPPFPLKSSFLKVPIGLIFCALVLQAGCGLAQTCPPRISLDAQGGFDVSVDRGCGPMRVQISNEDPAVRNAKYFFNFQGTDYKRYSNTPSTVRDTTYNAAGTYVIIQLGSKNGTASFFCRTVEVLPTPKPGPNVKISSCNPRELTVGILNDPNFRYDYYDIFWDAGNPQSAQERVFPGGASASYTYPNTIQRQIRVVGYYNAVACSTSSDPITVNPAGPNPSAPVISRLEVLGPNSLRLDYRSPQLGAVLDIFQKINGGASQQVAGSVAGPSRTFTNLTDTGANQYCFQVRNAADGCALSQPLSSAEICSIPLRVTAQNRQNDIQWTIHPATPTGVNFQSYELTKNGQPFRTYTRRTDAQQTDTDVQCAMAYTYRVTARIQTGSGTVESLSDNVQVTAVNNTPPPPVTDVYASVVNGKVELNWVLPAGSPVSKLFTVSRSGGSSPVFQQIGNTQTNRFTDDVNPAAGPYCYTVSYQDLCSNNATPSQPVCSIALAQQGSDLAWSSAPPFLEILQGYTVSLLDDQGNPVGAPVNVGTQTTYPLDLASATSQILRYRITARSGRGFSSFSNVISLSLSMRLWVPDAFSPNGDGLNDTFTAQGLFLNTFRMTIFNRWGEPLFVTDSADRGWDGTYDGKALEQGMYSYAIEVSDLRGERFTRRGAFLLLR